VSNTKTSFFVAQLEVYSKSTIGLLFTNISLTYIHTYTFCSNANSGFAFSIIESKALIACSFSKWSLANSCETGSQFFVE